MTGHHHDVVGQGEQLAANRFDDLFERAAPKIGATDAAGKKRVAA